MRQCSTLSGAFLDEAIRPSILIVAEHSTLLHREGAEPAQLDAGAASQSVGDLIAYRRHNQLDIRLAQMRMAGGKFRDELRSGQRRRPAGSSLVRQAPPAPPPAAESVPPHAAGVCCCTRTSVATRRVIERSSSAAWDQKASIRMKRHMSSETIHTVPFKA